MRFVVSIWLMIVFSLSLFTALVFSHQLLAPDLPPMTARILLVVIAWGVGLSSTATIQVLHGRAERAAERVARDETVVQLAGAVAHELNQPLTVVISGAELIVKRDQSPEELRAMALRIAEASQRMADIVGKLQHATYYRAKPYVGKVQIVDLDGTG